MKLPLNVTFLGTGTSQGIPIIGSDHPVCRSTNTKDKRLRVSVLVEWADYRVVIDCGPDFRQQMLRENVQRLDAVLLTHEHNDHIAGLDDIRPFYFKQGDIPFYAEKRVFKALKERFAYIFATENKYPGAPTITEMLVHEDRPISLLEKDIIPIRAFHGDLPIMGYRIDGFTYLTDVKHISEEEINKIKGTEILVLSALRNEPHHSHLNLDEAIELIQQIAPKKAYLTHISHQLGFHDEVEASLPENIYLAYDGLKFTV